MATYKSADSATPAVIRTIKTTDGNSHEIDATYWGGYSVDDLMKTLHGVVETYVVSCSTYPTGVTTTLTSASFFDILTDPSTSGDAGKKAEVWDSLSIGDMVLNASTNMADYWITAVTSTSIFLQQLEAELPAHHHVVTGTATTFSGITGVTKGGTNYAVVGSSKTVVTGLGTSSSTKPTSGDYVITSIEHDPGTVSATITLTSTGSAVGSHSHSYASTVVNATVAAVTGFNSDTLTYATVQSQTALKDVPALSTANFHTHNTSVTAAGKTSSGTTVTYLKAMPKLNTATVAGKATASNITVLKGIKASTAATTTGGPSNTSTGSCAPGTNTYASHTHTATIAAHAHTITLSETATATTYASSTNAATAKVNVVGAWVASNELQFPTYIQGATVATASPTVTVTAAGGHSHTVNSHTHSMSHTHTYYSAASNGTATLYLHSHAANGTAVTGYSSTAYTMNATTQANCTGSFTPHTHATDVTAAGTSKSGTDYVVGYGTTAQGLSGSAYFTTVSTAKEASVTYVTGSTGTTSVVSTLKVDNSNGQSTSAATVNLKATGSVTIGAPTISYAVFSTTAIVNASSSGEKPVTAVASSSYTVYGLSGTSQDTGAVVLG